MEDIARYAVCNGRVTHRLSEQLRRGSADRNGACGRIRTDAVVDRRLLLKWSTVVIKCEALRPVSRADNDADRSGMARRSGKHEADRQQTAHRKREPDKEFQ
jgi:hypothetical protein